MTIMIWFIIVAVIVILFYGMVSNATGRKSVDSKPTHSKGEAIPLNITVCSVEDILPNEIKPSEPLMNDDEFIELKKCVMRLRTMMNELSREQSLADMINEKSIEAGGDRMPDQAYFCQLLKTIFIRDLKHCYEKMGKLFRISTYTAEGQCLLLITDLLNEKASALSEYMKFQKALNPIDKPIMLAVIKYLSELTTESIAISVEGDEEFAFSAMLINFDSGSEYLDRYRSELRQLVSCISVICKETQVREQEWINQMK